MEHTITELHRLQGLSLNEKIEMTRERIKAWVDHWGLENCAVSFSGGKDSTVLLDIARQDYPKMEAAHVNTGLEFPEVEDFVKSYNNVTILRPKMNFVDVIRKYGYPMFSKEVAECVQGARKYLQSVLDREDEIARISTDRQTDRQTDSRMHSSIARSQEQASIADRASMIRMSGGGTTGNGVESVALESLMQKDFKNNNGAVYRTARLLGWLTKDNQIKANIPNKKDYSAFSQERYKFLLEAPFDVSNRCCNVMKKSPAHSLKRKMITAQMASESRLRTQLWLREGCNMYDIQNPTSNPMMFWTESDVLLYIREEELPIASVYGKIVSDDEENGQINLADLGLFDLGIPELHTTGCARTGCAFCCFGVHLEKRPNRFEMIDKVSNPALRDFCMRGGSFQDGLWKPDNRGLGFFFVLQWVNYAGGFNIYIPEYERYLKEYGNDRVYEELEKAKEIGKANGH